MKLGELFMVLNREQLVTLVIGDNQYEITARAAILDIYLDALLMNVDVLDIVADGGKLKVRCSDMVFT